MALALAQAARKVRAKAGSWCPAPGVLVLYLLLLVVGWMTWTGL